VLSASVYIAVCTARNRVRVRLRRLREPRYLVGAIVGVVYLYFSVFARTRGGRIRRGGSGANDGRAPLDAISAFQVTGTALGGLGLFLCALQAWILPMASGIFEYSEAERAILFPAPVSKRQLLAHRLIRSQGGALIGSLVVAVFAAPTWGLGRLRVGLGIWSLLVTIRVYFAAVLLTRARLRSTTASVRRVGWATIGAFALAFVVIGSSIAIELRPAPASATQFFVQLSRATENGIAHVVLWPFIAVLRPMLMTTWPSFFRAMAASLIVLAATTGWMLAGDTAFDLAVGESSERTGQEPSAPATRARTDWGGWTLAPVGRLEFALFWKGAMQTQRAANFKWRYVPPLIGAVFGIGGAAAAAMGAGHLRGPASFITILGAVIAAVAVLLGPQIMRADLRTDFQHLDLLKTWPARAADVIRGEMAWPIAAVSAIACGALLIAAASSGTALPGTALLDRWSVALAAIIAAPAIVAAQYTVHNAATIVFPAWVQLGSQRARGIDAMGQRLIMLAAILVSLVLFAVPGGVGAGALWLIFHRVAGSVVFVPMAVMFAAIVLTEVLVATELLAPAYDRIDLTSVEKAE
jgi:ABC-2 type transport system permease protein